MRKTGRKPLGLASQVFIGFGLGLLVGVFFGPRAAFLKIGGDAFIMMLQITVIPYVTVALVSSLGRLTLDDVKLLGLRAGGVLLALWAIGLFVVFLTPLAFPDWPSASFFSASQAHEAKPVDFLHLYIPANPFAALSDSVVPAIVVFSVLMGLALTNVPGREAILKPLSAIGDALMVIAGFIGKLAPYGVFAITASAAGTIDIADLGRLQVYVVTYVVIALLLSICVLPGLIAALTPLRYGEILHGFRGPLLTAFATGNLLIVLPMLAEDGKRLLAATNAIPTTKREDTDATVDVLIPAAFPFPSLGSILALMFVLFAGWYVGSSVAISDYPSVSLAGVASLFGGTVIAVPFLLDMLRLPADLFQVFVTVDVIGSRFGTLLGGMHLVAVVLIGACAMRGRLTLRLGSLVRYVAVSLGVTAIALLAIRVFYTYVVIAPYTKDQLLRSTPIIQDPLPADRVTVFKGPPREWESTGATSILTALQTRGVLRACYKMNDYPSAFVNAQGQLVGFDIQMAHRLAADLEIRLELLPIRSTEDAIERLEANQCDIVMSLMPIAPHTAEKVGLTLPVLDASVGLIVHDYRRNEFKSWAEMRDQPLRIAFVDSPTAGQTLHSLLPNAIPVRLPDKAALRALLAGGAKGVDAIGQMAEEGAAWTVLFPKYNMVVPQPAIVIPFGYYVQRDANDWLAVVDSWLLNVKSAGYVDKLYAYWMLGQIESARPPRWSIVRDVLHWVN